MGSGRYSLEDRSTRAASNGYNTKSIHEIFSERSINNAMNPNGVKIRESRDSDEHPNSISIVLALDVTGSMGSVPHHLVKEGLPKIMGSIIHDGIPDPQLLFLAVGDHLCDQSPLQIGQFESNDELLDKWLTTVYLEGGGGGNGGESYFLAWYFAAFHTSIDCLEKRNTKGFLFTIGDEPCLKNITKDILKQIMGPGEHKDYSSFELLDKAKEKYNVYHIHIKETGTGASQTTIDGWKELMGNNLIVAESHVEVSKIVSDIVAAHAPKLNSQNNSLGNITTPLL